MILHGYDLDEISRHRESFQQLHRKSDGKLGLVQALLAKGADVSAKTTKGETALTMAQDEKIKAAVLNGGAP
jgi:hypothetical protein